PAEGRVTPAETKVIGERAESSGIVPVCEEPLFMKLCSSSPHRRTAALVLNLSMEDSSSSLASRSVAPSLRSKHHNTLLIGLSTGQFDANNPKAVWCVSSDAADLFSPRPQQTVQLFAGGANRAVAPDDNNNLEIEDMEAEQSETEDVYPDDDLRELRASMERLLQEERSEEEKRGDEDKGGSGSNGSPPEEEGGDCFNGNPAEDDDDEDSAEVEELNGMAVDEEGSNGSPGDEEAGHTLPNGLEEEEHHNSESQLNEEWQSDDNGEEEEDVEAEQQDRIYSRLEELCFNLEQEIGFENFIEAYNKIKQLRMVIEYVIVPLKAIHEDENIDMGPD
ncbi:unnamed protein product, partial [Coregonus sp. 'balchen']